MGIICSLADTAHREPLPMLALLVSLPVLIIILQAVLAALQLLNRK